jgi:hypothetical protein
MSDDEELRLFAERLMHLIRDPSIVAGDHLIGGQVRGALGKRWQKLVADEGTRAAMSALLPDIVDQVLFQFLNAVDNDQLPLALRRTDGSFVALAELGQGEMAGRLMMGKGGWIDRFAAERFFDSLTEFDPPEDLADGS